MKIGTDTEETFLIGLCSKIAESMVSLSYKTASHSSIELRTASETLQLLVKEYCVSFFFSLSSCPTKLDLSSQTSLLCSLILLLAKYTVLLWDEDDMIVNSEQLTEM